MDLTGKLGVNMKGGCDEKRKLRVRQLVHIKMLNCSCDKNRLFLCFEGSNVVKLIFLLRHAQ
jgi:hypothetical protein